MAHESVCRLFALVLTAVTAFPAMTGAQPDGQPGAARALAVAYADGRTSYRVLRPGGGGFWTPQFPVVPDADTARDGLPLWALQIDHAIDGADVTVTVSLLYGRPHTDRVEVATVRVTSDRPARVEALAAFGVEPVTLSIVSVAPSLAYPVSVVCASGQLDVRVDPVAPDLPAYRVTVVNLSPRALMAFNYEMYRGDEKIAGGRRKMDRNEILAPSQGEHVFELPAAGRAAADRDDARAWPAMDQFVVTSVLWDDGMVEGDPELGISERALAAGRALQIARILDLLRKTADPARPGTPAMLRESFSALPVNGDGQEAARLHASLPDPAAVPPLRVHQSLRMGLVHARMSALADLDRFWQVVPDGNPAEFREWVAQAIAAYEAWLARVRG